MFVPFCGSSKVSSLQLLTLARAAGQAGHEEQIAYGVDGGETADRAVSSGVKRAPYAYAGPNRKVRLSRLCPASATGEQLRKKEDENY